MKSADPRWLGRELSQLTNALAKAGVVIRQLTRKTGSVRPFRITYSATEDGEEEEGKDFHGSLGSIHKSSDRNPQSDGSSATAKETCQAPIPHGSRSGDNFGSNNQNPFQKSDSATAKGNPNLVTAKGNPDLESHGSTHGSTHGSSQNPFPGNDLGISRKTISKTAKRNPCTFNGNSDETTLPFKPGDFCIYVGPDAGFNQIAQGKRLQIVELKDNTATVTSPGWAIEHIKPMSELRKAA